MERLPTEANPNKKKKSSGRLPSPQEMVSHYEKQGMGTQQASLKVIQDLQSALFRMAAANRSRKSADSKLDAVQSRLLHLEMKIDSKPSYPQALALGVASAGVWNAAVQLWCFVCRATDSSS
ncbi:hypothetical protein F511_04685 [Dorcoceras hygrometricum]|uniref:Uncharacterized protein n=1 Tax=Dorcoceras hygrometricum TaxID=472368 RepID=A0A2Z7B6S9_9LAMI|nr:hypothetical protein F511_04685 [Dorcoceras hygrometricum]